MLGPLCCAFGELLEREPITLYDMRPDDVQTLYMFCQNCVQEVNLELSTLFSSCSFSAEQFLEWSHATIPIIEQKPTGILSMFKESYDYRRFINLPRTKFNLIKSFCSLSIVLLGTKTTDKALQEALSKQLFETLTTLGFSVTLAKFITAVYSKSTQFTLSLEHDDFTMLQQLLTLCQDLLCLAVQGATSPEPFVVKQNNESQSILQFFFQACTYPIDHHFHEQWQVLLDQLLTPLILLVSSTKLSSGFVSSIVEGQAIDNSIKAVLTAVSTSSSTRVLDKFIDALHILSVLELLLSKVEQTREVFANIFAENSGFVMIIVLLQKLEAFHASNDRDTATNLMVKLIDMIPSLVLKCTEKSLLLEHVKALGNFFFKSEVYLAQQHILSTLTNLSISSENANVIVQSSFLNELAQNYHSLSRELSSYIIHLIGGVCRAAPESLQKLLSDLAITVLNEDVNMEYLYLLHGIIADAFTNENSFVRTCCINSFATKTLQVIISLVTTVDITGGLDKDKRKEQVSLEREQDIHLDDQQKASPVQHTSSLNHTDDFTHNKTSVRTETISKLTILISIMNLLVSNFVKDSALDCTIATSGILKLFDSFVACTNKEMSQSITELAFNLLCFTVRCNDASLLFEFLSNEQFAIERILRLVISQYKERAPVTPFTLSLDDEAVKLIADACTKITATLRLVTRVFTTSSTELSSTGKKLFVVHNGLSFFKPLTFFTKLLSFISLKGRTNSDFDFVPMLLSLQSAHITFLKSLVHNSAVGRKAVLNACAFETLTFSFISSRRIDNKELMSCDELRSFLACFPSVCITDERCTRIIHELFATAMQSDPNLRDFAKEKNSSSINTPIVFPQPIYHLLEALLTSIIEQAPIRDNNGDNTQHDNDTLCSTADQPFTFCISPYFKLFVAVLSEVERCCDSSEESCIKFSEGRITEVCISVLRRAFIERYNAVLALKKQDELPQEKINELGTCKSNCNTLIEQLAAIITKIGAVRITPEEAKVLFSLFALIDPSEREVTMRLYTILGTLGTKAEFFPSVLFDKTESPDAALSFTVDSPFPKNEFTISLWFKVDGISNAPLLSLGLWDPADAAILPYIQLCVTSGALSYQIDDNEELISLQPELLSLDRFNHVTIVQERKSKYLVSRVIVNGQQKHTFSIQKSSARKHHESQLVKVVLGDCHTAQHKASASRFYVGTTCIFSKALSPKEVVELYSFGPMEPFDTKTVISPRSFLDATQLRELGQDQIDTSTKVNWCKDVFFSMCPSSFALSSFSPTGYTTVIPALYKPRLNASVANSEAEDLSHIATDLSTAPPNHQSEPSVVSDTEGTEVRVATQPNSFACDAPSVTTKTESLPPSKQNKVTSDRRIVQTAGLEEEIAKLFSFCRKPTEHSSQPLQQHEAHKKISHNKGKKRSSSSSFVILVHTASETTRTVRSSATQGCYPIVPFPITTALTTIGGLTPLIYALGKAFAVGETATTVEKREEVLPTVNDHYFHETASALFPLFLGKKFASGSKTVTPSGLLNQTNKDIIDWIAAKRTVHYSPQKKREIAIEFDCIFRLICLGTLTNTQLLEQFQSECTAELLYLFLSQLSVMTPPNVVVSVFLLATGPAPLLRRTYFINLFDNRPLEQTLDTIDDYVSQSYITEDVPQNLMAKAPTTEEARDTRTCEEATNRLYFIGNWSERALVLFPIVAKVMLFRVDWWLQAEDDTTTKLGFAVCNGLVSCGTDERNRETHNVQMLRSAGELDAPRKIYVPAPAILCTDGASRTRFPIVHLLITHAKLTASLPASCYPFSFKHPLFDSNTVELSDDDSRRLKYAVRIFKLIEGILQLSITKDDYLQLQEIVFGMTTHTTDTTEEAHTPPLPSGTLMREDDYFPSSLFTNLMCIELLDRFIDFDQYIAAEKTGFISSLMRKTSKMTAAFPKYLRQDVPFPLYLFRQTPFSIFTVALRSFVVQSYRVKMTKECAELAAGLLTQTVTDHPCCDFVLYQLMLLVVKPRATVPPNDYKDFVEIFTFFDKKTEIANHQFLTPVMASVAGMLEQSGALPDSEVSLAKNVFTFVSGLWNTSDISRRILADAESGGYEFVSELLRIALSKRMAFARGALETTYNFAVDIATRTFQEGLKTLSTFGDLFEMLVRHKANIGNESKFLHGLFSQLFDFVLLEVKKSNRKALISTSGELKELTLLGRNIRVWICKITKLYLESKNSIGGWQTTFARTIRSGELSKRLLAFVCQMSADFSACKIGTEPGNDLVVCKFVLATELLGVDACQEFGTLLSDEDIESALSARSVGSYLLAKMLTESFALLHTEATALREFLARFIALAAEKHSEILKQTLFQSQLLYDICIMRYHFSDALELSQAKAHHKASGVSFRSPLASQTLSGQRANDRATKKQGKNVIIVIDNDGTSNTPLPLFCDTVENTVAGKSSSLCDKVVDQTNAEREKCEHADDSLPTTDISHRQCDEEQKELKERSLRATSLIVPIPKLTRVAEDIPIVEDYIQHKSVAGSDEQTSALRPYRNVNHGTGTVLRERQAKEDRRQVRNLTFSIPRRRKNLDVLEQRSVLPQGNNRAFRDQEKHGLGAFVTAQSIPRELEQCLSYLTVHRELIADQFSTEYVQDADARLITFLSGNGRLRKTLIGTAHALLVQATAGQQTAASLSTTFRNDSAIGIHGTASPKESFILELDMLHANFMANKEARSLAYYIHFMNNARHAVDRWLKRTRALFSETGVWGLSVRREFVKWKQDQTVCPRKFYCRMRRNWEFFDLFPSTARQTGGVSAGTEGVSERYERWVKSRAAFASTSDRTTYLPFGLLTTTSFQPCAWICDPVEPCPLFHENVLKQLIGATKVMPVPTRESRECSLVCVNASLVYGMEQAYGVLIQQAGSISFVFNYGVYDGVLYEMDDEKYRSRGVECVHSKVHRRQLIYHDTRQSKTVSFNLADVAAAYDRRFLQLELGTEVYLRRGKSYLFVFESVQETAWARKLFGSVSDATHLVTPSGALLPVKLRDVQRLWADGDLSNYEYLMCLNELSGRTFHDLAQYPVLPWVVADYHSAELDLERADTFRDLTKPIGALDPARAAIFAERYSQLSALEQETNEAPFHYGTHYSSSGTILYFLIRLESFSRMAADFQEGHFDAPDRVFSSVTFAWETASRESTAQIMELTPEFYAVPHFLYNHNQFDFGLATKLDGTVYSISDVRLPPWAHGSPHRFVETCVAALESAHASSLLNNWVDLIFGYKQRGREAQDALNVFHPLSYCGAITLDDIADISKRKTVLGIINNFGQTPKQLFTTPHPQKGRVSVERQFAAVERALVAKGELETVQEFFSKRPQQRPLALSKESELNPPSATTMASPTSSNAKHLTPPEKRGFTVWDFPHKLVVNSVKAIKALQNPITCLYTVSTKKQKEPRIIANARCFAWLPPDYAKGVVCGEPWAHSGNLAICDESGRCVKQLEFVQPTASNKRQALFGRQSTSLLCKHDKSHEQAATLHSASCCYQKQSNSVNEKNDGDYSESAANNAVHAESFYQKLPSFDSAQKTPPTATCFEENSVCCLHVPPTDSTSKNPTRVTLYAGLYSGVVVVAELDTEQLEIVRCVFLCSGTAPITALCSSPQYGMLISGDACGKVVFWDVARCVTIHTISCFHGTPVVAVAQDAATGDVAVVFAAAIELFSVNGEYIGMAEIDVTSQRIQYNLDTMLDYLKKPRAPFTCCMFVPQARGTFSLRAHALVAGHSDGTVSFWQVEHETQCEKNENDKTTTEDKKGEKNSSREEITTEATTSQTRPPDTPFSTTRKMQTYSVNNKANTCTLYAIVDRAFELAKIFEASEPISLNDTSQSAITSISANAQFSEMYTGNANGEVWSWKPQLSLL